VETACTSRRVKQVLRFRTSSQFVLEGHLECRRYPSCIQWVEPGREFALYQLREPEKQIEAMLRVLGELVPSELVTWNEFNMVTRHIRLITHPQLESQHAP